MMKDDRKKNNWELDGQQESNREQDTPGENSCEQDDQQESNREQDAPKENNCEQNGQQENRCEQNGQEKNREQNDQQENNREQDTRGAERLFRALGGIDEKFLRECENLAVMRKKKGLWQYRYTGVAAAVLCFLLIGTGWISVQHLQNQIKDQSSEQAPVAEKHVTGMGFQSEDALTEGFGNAMMEGSGNALMEESENARGAASENISVEEPLENTCLADSAFPDEEKQEISAEQRALLEQYSPKNFPDGGTVVEESEANMLTLRYTYPDQWNEFVVWIRFLGRDLPEEICKNIISVDEPEMYDERLCEIPYADTVPQAYMEKFCDPVFLAKDFQVDCVKARLVEGKGDSGDSAMPYGRFSILYESDEGYVQVEFLGKGYPDDIWKLLNKAE